MFIVLSLAARTFSIEPADAVEMDLIVVILPRLLIRLMLLPDGITLLQTDNKVSNGRRSFTLALDRSSSSRQE